MAEYNKQYTPTLWKNYPLTDTSINAYRLNHLEGGVNENDNRLVALSEDKAEQTVVNKMVKTVTLNKDTGVLTVTLLDGTKSTYDLDIEKVVANFDLNSNNDLVLTLADGTQKVVPLSKFVDTYTFKSSGTITFNTNGKEITAFIPDGSVTLAKLEATVLSTIRQHMLDAQTAKGQAEQAAENARGYAIGGTGFEGVSAQYFASRAQRYAVITDEAPKDNAQYYAQDAAKSAEEARQAAGCDGTAASISAVDVQGLVAAAGGNSNVQALINAVADQVINQLVAKGQIVNNLLATEPGNVLDATQGKALKDDITELYSDLGERLLYTKRPEATATLTSAVDQDNNAFLSFSAGKAITLLKFWHDQHVTIDHSADNGATWSGGSILTNADIQKGRVAALSCPANTITEHKLVFPKAFTVAPRVMLTLNSSTESPKYGSALPFTTNITSTGCTIRVANNSDTTFSPNIEWIAIAL